MRAAQSFWTAGQHLNSACLGTVSEIFDGEHLTVRAQFRAGMERREILRTWIDLERKNQELRNSDRSIRAQAPACQCPRA